jgi:hypothetical protein
VSGLIHIPDALPVLSRGNHHPGTGKACIMDAVSIISGRPAEQDHPSCVHPLLRPLFIYLNDAATDEQRPKLWEPALRAMGTGPDDLDASQRQRLKTALLLAQARRELTGQRLADHPIAAAVLRPLLAWHQAPFRTPPGARSSTPTSPGSVAAAGAGCWRWAPRWSPGPTS